MASANAIGLAPEPVLAALGPVIDEILNQMAEDLGVWANVLRDLAPLLQVVGLAFADLVRQMRPATRFLAQIARMFGYTSTLPALQSNEGRAVRIARAGSPDEYTNQSRASAFTLGANPGEQFRTSALQDLSRIRGLLNAIYRVGQKFGRYETAIKNVAENNTPTIPGADIMDRVYRAMILGKS